VHHVVLLPRPDRNPVVRLQPEEPHQDCNAQHLPVAPHLVDQKAVEECAAGLPDDLDPIEIDVPPLKVRERKHRIDSSFLKGKTTSKFSVVPQTSSRRTGSSDLGQRLGDPLEVRKAIHQKISA
jgi:hypothetical protein